ncbi:hypothetical protein TSUD_241880 [Trifolium subterraneum]|uniref:Uncharacterized protein n=1 Tax=Trifolium subterraneum TaxID=3900 RepID=A0A2Z6MF34_TRISU|nr:hypothetical protein TSUD_241880 [Trifolium subterraneum]
MVLPKVTSTVVGTTNRTTSVRGQGDSGRMALCCNNVTVVGIVVWRRQRTMVGTSVW